MEKPTEPKGVFAQMSDASNCPKYKDSLERWDNRAVRFRWWLLLGAIPLAVVVAFIVTALVAMAARVLTNEPLDELLGQMATAFGALAGLITLLVSGGAAAIGFLHNAYLRHTASRLS